MAIRHPVPCVEGRAGTIRLAIVQLTIGLAGAAVLLVTHSTGRTTLPAHATMNTARCAGEDSLKDRTDVVFCEPWEDADWWRHGYLKVASTSDPRRVETADVDHTTLVSTGCVSGSCLRVEMRRGESGALAIHWPLLAANLKPEALYLRYYLKLGASFDPALCTSDTGESAGSGGKFPGLADVRTWPEEQCGNGGRFADGINCWSMRAVFRDCLAGESTVRQACKSPLARTRIGSYLYYYGQHGFDNAGIWDREPWGQGFYDEPFGSCRTPADVGGCGKGFAGQLENGKWYAIEMYVKMNTPGQANGVVRGWVNGALSYEKTNMIWRLPGHDNLHVRTIWLNVHAGGEFVGLCRPSEIFLDQLVAATGGPIGLLGSVGRK